VVSGGLAQVVMGRSSNPVTLTSVGARNPRSLSACSTPKGLGVVPAHDGRRRGGQAEQLAGKQAASFGAQLAAAHQRLVHRQAGPQQRAAVAVQPGPAGPQLRRAR
jgi:hypothetical protein